MEYSKYFGKITKEKGQPQLNDVQYVRMQNIIHQEGVLHGIDVILRTFEDSSIYDKHTTLRFRHYSRLTDLTSNLKPEELLNEMILLSDFPTQKD